MPARSWSNVSATVGIGFLCSSDIEFQSESFSACLDAKKTALIRHGPHLVKPPKDQGRRSGILFVTGNQQRPLYSGTSLRSESGSWMSRSGHSMTSQALLDFRGLPGSWAGGILSKTEQGITIGSSRALVWVLNKNSSKPVPK